MALYNKETIVNLDSVENHKEINLELKVRKSKRQIARDLEINECTLRKRLKALSY